MWDRRPELWRSRRIITYPAAEHVRIHPLAYTLIYLTTLDNILIYKGIERIENNKNNISEILNNKEAFWQDTLQTIFRLGINQTNDNYL